MTITNSSNSRSSCSSSSLLLRPLSCELSCLSSCDGSALFTSGSTQIMASVHGPIAPRLPHLHENANRGQLSIVMKSSGNNTNNSNNITYEKEYEYYITRVLQSAIDLKKYPRSIIQIVLTIITNDGSILSTATNAAVAALLDASINLLYLPTCTTCLVLLSSSSIDNTTNGDGNETAATTTSTIQLDPTSEQEQVKSCGYVVIAINPTTSSSQNNIVVASHTSCNLNLSTNNYLECCDLSKRASQAIKAFYRIAVEQKVQREVQTLWS